MASSTHRIQQAAVVAVVCYFIIFTALCWLLDLAGTDHLTSQTRAGVAFDAGVVGGVLAFVCALVLRCSHRKLAIAGFVSCLLWTVWICLPRF
jgi:hypothetical protein